MSRQAPISEVELAHHEDIRSRYKPDLEAWGLYHPDQDAMSILILWRAVHTDPVMRARWSVNVANFAPLTEKEKAALKIRICERYKVKL
jgi:hypothetical protein